MRAATCERASSMSRLGPLSEVMDARRVAELVAQDRHHPFDDGRRHRRRGVVIEINALHG